LLPARKRSPIVIATAIIGSTTSVVGESLDSPKKRRLALSLSAKKEVSSCGCHYCHQLVCTTCHYMVVCKKARGCLMLIVGISLNVDGIRLLSNAWQLVVILANVVMYHFKNTLSMYTHA